MKFFSIPSKIQPVFFTFLLLASILVLFFFPVRTASTIWAGYRVLSCDLEIEEAQITNLLDSVGINDYVSQSRSMLKSTNPFIPVHPLIEKANQNRSAWFINSDSNLRYFYIPDSSTLYSKIEKAFSETTNFWNLEESDGFISIPIFFLLSLIVISLFISRNRIKRLIFILPSILLSWSLNTFLGYVTAISAVIFITFLGLLLPHNKIELLPAQKAQRIRSHPELLISASFIVVFSGIGGLHSIVLTLFTFLSSFSLGMIFKICNTRKVKIQSKKRLHTQFTSLAMHPKTIKALHTKKFLLFSFLIFLLFILLGGPFYMNVMKKTVTKYKIFPQELSIPMPTGYTDQAGFTVLGFKKSRENKTAINLPDLGDFISLQWQLSTAPWIKIGETRQDPQEGSVIEMFEYKILENGILAPSVTGNITFDNRFIAGVLDSDHTPLEKMLQKQGRFVSAHIMRLQ